MATSAEEPRTQPRREPRSWASLILTDVQFWIPVVVLAGGLVVLRWIA